MSELAREADRKEDVKYLAQQAIVELAELARTGEVLPSHVNALEDLWKNGSVQVELADPLRRD